jgi:hypothetical protein
MSKVIPIFGRNVQGGEMSAVAAIAQSLERRERERVGGTLAQARQRIADKLRIGVGTFENLVRGRVKRVDAAVRDRLQALIIREIETEIMRLNHELETYRRSGVALGSDEISEIEAHLCAARSLLERQAQVI